MEDNYLFILGRQQELSLAELLGYAEGRGINLEIREMNGPVALIRGNLPEPKQVMSDLAGVVKIASAGLPLPRPETANEWLELLEPILASAITPKQSLTFGLSFYGEQRYIPLVKEQERLALVLKRALKIHVSHLRWVSGRGKPLTSVQVAKNKLDTEQGCELIIYCSIKTAVIGKTLAVQEFEEWGRRDYNRPRRDAKRGMLPPKLARMMVNMLGLPSQGTLLDPFCGSGTVLMEAAMLGWPKLIGADKSARAVKDAKANLLWLYTHSLQKLFSNSRELENRDNVEIFTCSIENLPRRLAPSSVEAIVTEPYLGMPFVSPPTAAMVSRLQKELLPLYNNILQVFAEVLTINGRAIFIAPRWRLADGRERDLLATDLHWPKNLRARNLLQTLSHYKDTLLIYRRPHQFVAREIILLEKVSS